MIKYRYIGFVIFLLVIIMSCKTGTKKDQNSEVMFLGRVDAVMKGDLSGNYSLDSIINVDNMYALGAMNGLSGEIQIYNGQDFSSVVERDSVIVSSELAQEAAFVVYSKIKNWKNIKVPLSVSNTETLIGFFEYNEESELNTEIPFMFLIEGEVEELSWHVIRHSTNDSLNSKMDHKSLAKSGIIEDQVVEIIGVYSRDHQGIFTHHGIPVHMHFRTADGMLAGHVDDVEFGPEMNLKIPPIK